MNEKTYLEILQDFLDSGTPKAQAAKIALAALTLASLPLLIFAAASMGNTVQVLKQFKTSRKFNNKQLTDAIIYLRHKKLIEYVAGKKGKTVVRITTKGKSRLRAFSIDLMKIKKPKTWDKKWRLVMFDIPMRFTKGREALRYHLKKLGFYQFQKSVWIYPYSCEDEIIFIADFFGVKNFVEIIAADSILRDEKLIKYFNLEKYC